MVGLAGFEPAASSSRTKLRFLRRERKIAEGNGIYRGKFRKNEQICRTGAGVSQELELKNGKKKLRRGYVRGYVAMSLNMGRSCFGAGAIDPSIFQLLRCVAARATVVHAAPHAVSTCNELLTVLKIFAIRITAPAMTL